MYFMEHVVHSPYIFMSYVFAVHAFYANQQNNPYSNDENELDVKVQ